LLFGLGLLGWIYRNDPGATMNTKSQLSSLHHAAIFESPETIHALLRAGADINASDWEGETALHWAALSGTPETIQILLDAGADVYAVSNELQTPLHCAAKSEDLEKMQARIQVLLNAGADFNVKDKDQCTPEDIAKGECKDIFTAVREKNELLQSVAEIAPAPPSVPRKRLGGYDRDR
jgi:ankyrin repeat protein